MEEERRKLTGYAEKPTSPSTALFIVGAALFLSSAVILLERQKDGKAELAKNCRELESIDPKNCKTNECRDMKKICSNFRAGEYSMLTDDYAKMARKLSKGLERMNKGNQRAAKGIQKEHKMVRK